MHESEGNRIVKNIRRFELARFDMEQAAAAAQALGEGVAPGASHALEVGMVVCYARPFTNTDDWINPLGGEWLPLDEDARRLHNALVRLRNEAFAHTDRESGRDVEDISSMMGGEPRYAASVPTGIRPEVLPRIQSLCESQHDRFREERRRLEAQLTAP